MNLNQLKYVVSVAKLSSFGTAADACFVTQPSLSNGIAALEEELGAKLFERSTRQVKLSSFGSSLLPQIKMIVDGEKQLKNEAKALISSGKQTVRLGVSPLVSSDLSLFFMAAFDETYAEHEILLIENNLNDLTAALENGDLDIIIVPDTGANLSNVSKLFIANEPLYFVEQEKSKQQSISVNEMEDKTFLMVPDSCGLAIITRQLFADKAIYEYEGRAMSYQVLENWALSGLGAAIIPKSKISRSLEMSIPVMQNGERLTIEFCAYWKKLPLVGFDQLLNKVVLHQTAQ